MAERKRIKCEELRKGLVNRAVAREFLDRRCRTYLERVASPAARTWPRLRRFQTAEAFGALFWPPSRSRCEQCVHSIHAIASSLRRTHLPSACSTRFRFPSGLYGAGSRQAAAPLPKAGCRSQPGFVTTVACQKYT